MKVITVAVQKGGTGKTTTAAALAEAGAIKNKKILAIDLDPQGNLSFALNACNKSGVSSLDLLQSGNTNVIKNALPNIDVIPSAWGLSTVKSFQGSARRLQEALKPLKKNYDLILIDTPPTAGELQYNALQTADELIIPLSADIYSLQSLYQITATAKQIQKSNTKLKIKGFVLTKVDNRSTISRQMKENIINTANKNKVHYLGSIRQGIAIQEATALQKNLFEYAPKSNPAKDYLTLFENL